MYDWCYTINFIGGKCLHGCSYCYVPNKIAPRLARMGNRKYYGSPTLIEKEFKVPLIVPENYIVFVQSCGDIMGDWIPDLWIRRILERIRQFPETIFLLQSKNPMRFHDFEIPPNCILGTTIETNRESLLTPLTKAPKPRERFLAMKKFSIEQKLMLSFEPIMDFDLPTMLIWAGIIHPAFVSIGADSGNNNLPEPSPFKLKQLLWQLELLTEVRKKKNLKRLLEEKQCL